MAKVVEFHIGKGKTRRPSEDVEEWERRHLELTVKLPEQYSEEDYHVALTRAERFIDDWLQSEMPHVPQFNPEDLMKHPWKGKKDGKGGYLKGSTAWGWDFKNQFSEDTIRALEKTSPLVIDDFEFTLGETIVQAKKKKK